MKHAFNYTQSLGLRHLTLFVSLAVERWNDNFKSVVLLFLIYMCTHMFYAIFDFFIDGRERCLPDTRRKVNIHNILRIHPRCLLNVLCTVNLPPASRGVVLN